MSKGSSFRPSELMAGMMAGTVFLSEFNKRLLANGGSPQLIHHMTSLVSAAKLDELAKFAVSQHFPVPRSAMEEQAQAASVHEFNSPEGVESDKRFCWDIGQALDRYGIPVVSFSTYPFSDGTQDRPCLPFPDEVCTQLEGVPIAYPLLLTYRGEPHVVVYSRDVLKTGSVISPGSLDHLRIAPAKYFDLDN
jgi:hypothetical protein